MRLPSLEPLEARMVLSALSYHDWPLLSNVQVDAVFYGSVWNTNSTLAGYRSYIDNFLSTIVGSPYLSDLSQYSAYSSWDSGPSGFGVYESLGQGALRSSRTYAVGTPLYLTDSQIATASQIQNYLNSAFPQGSQTSSSDTHHLIMIFTPPGTVDELLGGDKNGNPHWYTSATDFYGYHFAFINNNMHDTYYAVVAFPGGPNAAIPGLSPEQQITATASHELAEAVTDAIPDVISSGGGGWYTNKGTVVTVGNQGIAAGYQEIGDLGEMPDGNGGWLLGGGFAVLDGYTIQLYFSNASGQCDLPSGARRIAVRSSGSGSGGTDMAIDEIQGPTGSGTTVEPLPIQASPGQSFDGLVAIVYSKGSAPGAAIRWGDDPSAGAQALSVTSIGGNEYEVTGSHVYANAGAYTYQLTYGDSTTNQALSGQATVASAPAVGTESTTAARSTAVTLGAGINPGGSDTTVSFVYGTDPILATGTATTAGQEIGGGTGPVAVSAALTGLSPGITYYFQAVAQNGVGTTVGSILQFTTPLFDPPVVTTQPGPPASSAAATLDASVDPNGSPTAVSFQYSTDPGLPANVVTTLAGAAGQYGGADGTGAAARFFAPSGVAVDAAGNLYVADSMNDTIRKVTPAGVVTTLAGSPGQRGSADGTGAAARFDGPSAVAVDAAGNVFVADTGNDMIREITPAGVVTTLAGSPGQQGSADGTGPAVRFYLPASVAVDAAGNVYVADTFNATIRKISPGGVVTTLAGSPGRFGSADGIGSAARFDDPEGIAVDGAGNVYVTDTYNATIRKITPSGVVTTLAGSPGQAGSADGTGSAARFAYALGGVAVDAAGNVYVGDFGNDTIREITPAGVVTTLAGSPGAIASDLDGTGSAARFFGPAGLAVDALGHIYVADENNDTIRELAVPTVLVQGDATGSSPVELSATLTGLTPGTTYYFRAVATNDGGTAAGSILRFSTLPSPTPIPSPTPTPIPSPSPSPAPPPTPTPIPSPSPSPAPSPTPSPTPTPPPVTVTGLHWQAERFGRGKPIMVLDVTFSGALNASDADDLAAYSLGAASGGGKHARGRLRSVPLVSATYDPGTATVQLRPARQVPNKGMQLTIVGGLLRDAQGRALDGNRDGQPGGDFVATLSRGGAVSMARARVAAAIDALMTDGSFAGLARRRHRHPRGAR